MLKLSPLAVITCTLLTIVGFSYDALGARPGGAGGAGRAGGPGGAGGAGRVGGPGGAGGAGRVGGVGGVGGAAGLGGAAGVGHVGGVGGVGGAAGVGGASGIGRVGGAGGVGRVGGAGGIANPVINGANGQRVSPNQLNNFIGRPGVDNRTNIDNRNYRLQQTNITQVNLQKHLGSLSTNVFTPNWYAQNPGAYRGQYPHADAYAAANWNNAATWVGIAAAPVAYGYDNSGVVYQTNNYTTTDNTQPANTAAALANTASNAGDDASAEWLPLGVFGLVPGDQTSATAMTQLAVSKEGVLNGTYLDLLSHVGTPLRGAIDPKTQRAAWKVGDSENVVFETTLASLTTDSSPVSVRFGTQPPQAWQLIRTKNAQQE